MEGDFDCTVLRTGKRLTQCTRAPAIVTLSKGTRSDCLRGPISWLIVSPRFVTICGDYLNKHVQVLELITRLPDGRKVTDRYVVLNLIGTIDALASPGQTKKDRRRPVGTCRRGAVQRSCRRRCGRSWTCPHARTSCTARGRARRDGVVFANPLRGWKAT